MAGFDLAALERRVAALETNRGASLRFGTVTGVDAADGSARVQLPDGGGLVSWPLRVLQRRSLKDKAQCLPDLGEPVACLFAGQGMEAGVVLGAHYSQQTPAPGQTPTHDYTIYEDGTEIWYDRAAHKLIAKVKGDAEVETEGQISAKAKKEIRVESQVGITLCAPLIRLEGDLAQQGYRGGKADSVLNGTYTVCNGSIHVPDGDVTAEDVSVLDHQHTDVQKGTEVSGPPVGGGSGEGGDAGEGGEGDGDGGFVSDSYWEMLFEIVRDVLPETLTPIDELLLCLPDIAKAEAEKCLFENDRKGWQYLSAMLRRWLCMPPVGDVYSSTAPPFWIDWNWVVSYGRVNAEYMDFASDTGIPYMLNTRAKQSLGNILRNNNGFGAEVRHFDFINTDWWKWKALYHTYRAVPGLCVWPDGLLAAMEGFTLRALAAGWTEPNGSGGHTIHVERMAVFAHDVFNFAGEAPLGFWNCTEKDFSVASPEILLPNSGYFKLENKDFRQFAVSHGRGGDFQVLSKPHFVEFFRGKSYDYA